MANGGVSGTAAIEPEGELVEVGLQVLGPQAVIDAETTVSGCRDAMDGGHDDVGGHRPIVCGLIGHAWRAEIARRARRSWRLESGTMFALMKTASPRHSRRCARRTAEPQLFLGSASRSRLRRRRWSLRLGERPRPPSGRIILEVDEDEFRLVDLHETGQRRRPGATMARRSSSSAQSRSKAEPSRSRGSAVRSSAASPT